RKRACPHLRATMACDVPTRALCRKFRLARSRLALLVDLRWIEHVAAPMVCNAKTPEDQRKAGQTCRRGGIRQHFDKGLLERSPVRKPMWQLARQHDRLVTDPPNCCNRVGGQDGGRPIDKKPEGRPGCHNTKPELGPQESYS